MVIDVVPDLAKAILGYWFMSVRAGELREVRAGYACCDSGSGAGGIVVASRRSGSGGEFEGNVGGV